MVGYLVEKLQIFAIDQDDLKMIILGIVCGVDDNMFFGSAQWVANKIKGFEAPEYDFWFMRAKAATDATFAAAFAYAAYGSAAAAAQAFVDAGVATAFAVATSPTGVGAVGGGAVAIEEALRGVLLLGVSFASTCMATRSANNMAKSVAKFNKTVGRSAAAKVLGQNLENATHLGARSVKPSFKHAAHHIAAGFSKKAAEARRILKKYGIDINAAENGVFLPIQKGVSKACYHPKLHTNAYYKRVNDMLQKARSKDDVIAILDDIAEQLLNGTFPH